jgi:opacity protein-like surface antigen
LSLRRGLLFACLVAALAAGCGAGLYQTAETLPPGEVRVVLGGAFVGNELVEQRGVKIYNFQPDLSVRVGVADGVDVGLSSFMLGGLLADVKWRFLPADWNFALALRGGFAAGFDVDQPDREWFLHVPIGLIASYRFDFVTPYVSLGYGFFWIFGRALENGPAPGVEVVGRKGYGDEVLRLTAGVEFRVTERIALYLEYTFMPAVVDDPGDNFAFVDTHIAGIGMTL